jgi:hypothetical protein
MLNANPASAPGIPAALRGDGCGNQPPIAVSLPQPSGHAVVEEHGWLWHILQDPDGNEFCVLQPPPDYWAGTGPAAGG